MAILRDYLNEPLLRTGRSGTDRVFAAADRAFCASTFDVCGHLLPGSYDDVRAWMDAYLAAEEPQPAG